MTTACSTMPVLYCPPEVLAAQVSVYRAEAANDDAMGGLEGSTTAMQYDGTVPRVAPGEEQHKSMDDLAPAAAEVDGAAVDVWCAGVVLHDLFFGGHPFLSAEVSGWMRG